MSTKITDARGNSRTFSDEEDADAIMFVENWLLSHPEMAGHRALLIEMISAYRAENLCGWPGCAG